MDKGNGPAICPSEETHPVPFSPLLPHMTALRARVALLRTAAPDENKAGRGSKDGGVFIPICL